MSAPDRRALLDRDHGALSMRRQCRLLSVARSGVYRAPRPANGSPREGGDLALMRRLALAFKRSSSGFDSLSTSLSVRAPVRAP